MKRFPRNLIELKDKSELLANSTVNIIATAGKAALAANGREEMEQQKYRSGNYLGVLSSTKVFNIATMINSRSPKTILP